MATTEKTLDEILQGRFVKRVLQEQSKEINLAQVKYISGHKFGSPHWLAARGFTANESALEYAHRLTHRFVDMKTRQTDKGKKKKKAHPVHNKIIWGHYNNIVRELSYGYTEAVKEELKGLEEK